MRWIQVTWGDACFGLGIEDGQVAQAPDLAKWARGQNERTVANWYRARGATFTALDDAPEPQRPGELWWCDTCTGRHTIAGIQRCRASGGQQKVGLS